MKQGYLSEYFVGVGTKVLTGTEVDPAVSRGHELQGIDHFRAFLGTPADKVVLPVRYVWLPEEGEPARLDSTGTWYDGRRKKSHREPEYRLYYPKKAEEIVHRARPGDSLFLCQPKHGSLIAIFCPKGSSVEQQLLWLFGLQLPLGKDINQIDLRIQAGRHLDMAARQILELIDIEVDLSEDRLLGRILKRFGGAFPTTRTFSSFARSIASGVDAKAEPDEALLQWMELEERLFLTLEKHLISRRLEEGFRNPEGVDVEGFMLFSLSVHNRRKSRAGWALANHIEELLKIRGIRYKREATTEKRNGPDFLFPGEEQYRDPLFPDRALAMLAAKTSCKDRWRQVLKEADRISMKHLLTLEPGISVGQTEEMRKANLQLVVPARLHDSYQQKQRAGLMNVGGFLDLAERLSFSS